MLHNSVTYREFLQTPLAELERYGLHVRWIAMLEARCGLYVADLAGMTCEELIETTSHFHTRGAAALQSALRQLAADLNG